MNTEHKVEEQGKQIAIHMERSTRGWAAALAGMSAAFAGAAGVMRPFGRVISRVGRHYGPCQDCGNPAKGGHCFKCQQKAAAA